MIVAAGAAMFVTAAAEAQILYQGAVIRSLAGPSETYGHSTGFNGQVAAMGSMYGNRVMLSTRTKDGGYTAATTLDDPFGRQKGFGHALAMENSTLVVGAPFTDGCGPGGGPLFSGVVSVFNVNSNGAEFRQQLWHDGIDRIDKFGSSVDVSGDSIIVGAKSDVTLGHASGTAYVFRQVEGVWVKEAQLVARDGRMGDLAGWSVSIGGNVAVVGAPFGTTSVGRTGTAQVFERIGGVWTSTQTLQAATPSMDGAFGVTVDTDGTRIIVGETNRGSVYIFGRGSDGRWRLETMPITGPAQLGASVKIEGNAAMIGSPATNSVWRFERSNATGWRNVQQITPSGMEPGAQFGSSISMFNGEALVGARIASNGGMVMHLSRTAGGGLGTGASGGAVNADATGVGMQSRVNPMVLTPR
jgi:hypothetical protein